MRTFLLSLSLFLCLVLRPSVNAIWLELPSTGTKCVSEELHNNVVVIADYAIIPDAERHAHVIPTVSLKVTSPYGNNLHHQENVTHGQFAFTTTESGTYLACFWTDSKSEEGKGATINLDWKTGVGAKDWDSVAKKENIEGLELELEKLTGLVDSIHENLNYLKNRESEMREVSEATNARVAWFSIMSIGLCISVSGFQLWYLKRYFHKKKLI